MQLGASGLYDRAVRGANRRFADVLVAHSKEWEQCARLGDALDRARVFLAVDNGVRVHGVFERGATVAGSARHARAVQAYAASAQANLRPSYSGSGPNFACLDATVRFTHVSIEAPADTPWDAGLSWDSSRDRWYRVEAIGPQHVRRFKSVHCLGREILNMNRESGYSDGWTMTVPVTRPTARRHILSIPRTAVQAIPFLKDAFDPGRTTQGYYAAYEDGMYDAWPRTAETPADIPSYGDTRTRDSQLESGDPSTHYLYHTLGLARDATPLEVKKAYNAKSRSMHPDKGGSKDAFAEVNRASRILRDDELKRIYDARGDWVRFAGGSRADTRFDCRMHNPYVLA